MKLSKTMEAALTTLAPFSRGRGRGGVSAERAKDLGIAPKTLDALVARGFAFVRDDLRGHAYVPRYKLTEEGLALA